MFNRKGEPLEPGEIPALSFSQAEVLHRVRNGTSHSQRCPRFSLSWVAEAVYMAYDYGWKRENSQSVLVQDIGVGAGIMQCPECGGLGEWSHFHPEPDLFPYGLDCVECKGQGFIYVSI